MDNTSLIWKYPLPTLNTNHGIPNGTVAVPKKATTKVTLVCILKLCRGDINLNGVSKQNYLT